MMRLVAGLIGNTGVMYNNEAQFAKTCKKKLLLLYAKHPSVFHAIRKVHEDLIFDIFDKFYNFYHLIYVLINTVPILILLIWHSILSS